jgi:hypothetical protein
MRTTGGASPKASEAELKLRLRKLLSKLLRLIDFTAFE